LEDRLGVMIAVSSLRLSPNSYLGLEPVFASAGTFIIRGKRMNPQTVVIGIDVGKDQLDVARNDQSAPWHVANSDEGIQQLIAELVPLAPERVVLEATAGYERAAVQALWLAGLPVALAMPTRVRRFAQASGQLAKTDRLDAKVIARFGAVM